MRAPRNLAFIGMTICFLCAAPGIPDPIAPSVKGGKSSNVSVAGSRDIFSPLEAAVATTA